MVWAFSLLTTDLIIRSLTAGVKVYGIRSLIRFSNCCQPLAHSVLYLHHLIYPTLALKLFRGEPAISEFDWNFSAIHSSSHGFSTPTWFGPPRGFTLASTWPWIGHPVSGLRHATSRAIHTWFPFGCAPEVLNLAAYRNSLARSTKSTSSHT